jgi:hypothetical protein
MTIESYADYARRHSVSRKQVCTWKQRGYLVTINDRVDVEKSDAKLRSAGLGRFNPIAKPKPAASELHPPSLVAELPPHLRFVTELANPADALAAIGLAMLAYRLPAQMASLAVAAGADMPAGYALFAAATSAVCSEAMEVMQELGIEPAGPDWRIWNPGARDVIDWPALAEAHGLTFDEEACRARLAERFGGDDGE